MRPPGLGWECKQLIFFLPSPRKLYMWHFKYIIWLADALSLGNGFYQRALLHQQASDALTSQQEAGQAQCSSARPLTQNQRLVSPCDTKRKCAGNTNLPAYLWKGENPFLLSDCHCRLSAWWMTVHCPSAWRWEWWVLLDIMLERWLLDPKPFPEAELSVTCMDTENNQVLRQNHPALLMLPRL